MGSCRPSRVGRRADARHALRILGIRLLLATKQVVLLAQWMSFRTERSGRYSLFRRLVHFWQC